MTPASFASPSRSPMLRRIALRLPRAALALAVAAVLLLAAGPLGWRLGLMHFRTAFSTLLPWAAYVALAAAALGLLGLALGRRALGRSGTAMAIAGLLIGAATAYLPLSWNGMRGTAPSIHDITTDVDHPPGFAAVLPARAAEDAAPVAYGGAKVAEQQKAAYPDIAPLTLAVPPAEAFKRALDTARRRDLAVVATRPESGSIEMSQSSRWFGFTDDCAVRVAPAGAGSRVDMRCVSRQGRGDFGVNAARIRSYMAALKASG